MKNNELKYSVIEKLEYLTKSEIEILNDFLNYKKSINSTEISKKN